MGSTEPAPSQGTLDRATLDLLPDPAWLSRADGTILFCNAAYRRRTALGDAVPTSALMEHLVHADDREAAYAAWRSAVDAQRPVRAEVRMRAPDGTYHWFRSHAEPLHGPTGACVGWIGTLASIDADRIAQERSALLAAANALFATESEPQRIISGLLGVLVPRHADFCAIDLFDERGRFERVEIAGSEAVRAALLASRTRFAHGDADVRGTAWDIARNGGTIVVSSERDEGWSEVAATARHAMGVRSAIVVPLDDGRRRIGAMSLGRIDPGAAALGADDLPFYVDLAARATAAIEHARVIETLAASERNARAIADEMPALLTVRDAGGEVTWINVRYRRYTGLTAEAMRGGGWRVLVHPDDLERVASRWDEALTRGRPFEVQFRVRRHDGVYRWFLSRIDPVRDETGAIVSWIGTNTDIDERKRAEDALRVALEATTAFGTTLDASVTLQRLADLCVDHVAEWCGVYVLDEREGALLPAALAHAERRKVRTLREYLRRFPPAQDGLLQHVAQTGVAARIDRMEAQIDTLRDPEQRAAARALGLRSILVVPLETAEARYGVFSLALEREGGFSDEDEWLASLIAQRAAIAVANARLYERQREVARTLQSAFLPEALPHDPAYALDGAYVAGTTDLTVGGDWYDAFRSDDGTLALSLGDVAGHGLDAAVPMGKMRQTFRALAMAERDPARVLALADGVLRREHPDVFVTAFAASLDAATRTLRYANAGHPAPFVRAAGGALRRLPRAGLPLGVGAVDDAGAHETTLDDGDLLVAFSDGLIEITRDIDEGERRLAHALAHPAFEACSAPASLLRALLVPSVPGDDVAILALRIAGGDRWSFDAHDARAAQHARRAFAQRLAGLGAGADAALAAETIFGELTANAARHAPGRLDLALRQTGNGLVLAALDRGAGFRWSTALPDAESERGRGLFLIDALSRAVRSEYLDGFGTYVEVVL